MDAPDWRAKGERLRANYKLLVENLLDLSRPRFIRRTTLGAIAEPPMKFERGDGRVTVTRNGIRPRRPSSTKPEDSGKTNAWIAGGAWTPPAFVRLDIGAARAGAGAGDGNRSQGLATSTSRRRKRRPTISGSRRTISDEPWIAGLLAQNIHEGFLEESSAFSRKTCGATPPRVDINHDGSGLRTMLNALAESRPRAAQASE